MKNLKTPMLIIAVLSIAIALAGFVLDLNERIPDILTNITDVLMLSFAVFSVLFPVYLLIRYILKTSGMAR